MTRTCTIKTIPFSDKRGNIFLKDLTTVCIQALPHIQEFPANKLSGIIFVQVLVLQMSGCRTGISA